MSAVRTLCATAVIAVVGLGCGLWMVITAGEERLIKNLPESNPVRMEEAKKRMALVMQAMKEAAATDDNIAKGYGGSEK
ncbi:ubiquinol-cytochrome-c reductase complex assembly factor 3 [Cyclopterus lumpus]|uniref:Ubiquinol-cytochrome-c reductase complex assembly factor 3 n=1 Tax=Cyclopterus lumpus TaxID=8103 RepID=A0A8C2W7N5_CYCLU|nr:ubiquinol-cytochrome-c reductase complex assembly factor 3 [Cyclopterus lumpus]